MIFETHQQQAIPTFSRAVIVSNEDPKKLGRVQVSYPWMSKQSTGLASDWARVVSPFASSSSGLVNTPKPDDEVIVCFENGDLNLPIVMGMLFSQKNPLPEKPSSGVGSGKRPEEVSYLETRGGHKLYFDDSSSGSGIKLNTSSGKKLELSDQDQKIILSDEKGNQVSIDSDQISIENDSGDLVSIKKGKISIQAASKIELGKGATEALVKGETFVKLFNSHVHGHPNGSTYPPTTPLQPTIVLSKKVKSE